MNELQKIVAERYPFPENDILEEIKQDRLRSAFIQGVYWCYSQMRNTIPLENKGAPIGYNTACEEIIDEFEGFFEKNLSL